MKDYDYGEESKHLTVYCCCCARLGAVGVFGRVDEWGVPQPPSRPRAARNAGGSASRNPELDAQIAHLRAIRERLSRANTPEERQALLAERTQVMQEAMATMHKTVGMPMGMRPPKGKSKDLAAQTQLCQGMMGQHMALMQEMMQSMMDGQGMGGGMGIGGGMMTK